MDKKTSATRIPPRLTNRLLLPPLPLSLSPSIMPSVTTDDTRDDVYKVSWTRKGVKDDADTDGHAVNVLATAMGCGGTTTKPLQPWVDAERMARPRLTAKRKPIEWVVIIVVVVFFLDVVVVVDVV